jgi:hypothetical protein
LPALLLGIHGLALAIELPERGDYAYGFPLEFGDDSDYYSADLSIEVYRSVSDPKLRDTGVYNAQGQPVPRIFERPATVEEGTEQEFGAGLIPLYGPEQEQADQLNLLLRREADSTRLEFSSRHPAAVDDGIRQPAAYIIDLRENEHRLQRLILDWPPVADGFIGTVLIETGDDLRHWRPVAKQALADLQFEGTHIKLNSMTLNGATQDFLRLSWRDLPTDWRLGSVTALYTNQNQEAPRDWLELDRSSPGETDREHLFDAGGYPPIDRVQLLLPDENVVLRANVFHRRHDQEKWRLAHNGIFYNITRRENTLQSTPAVIGEARAGQWKVTIESGATQGPIRLQLGWRPDRLVFVAQGPGPFTLVTGNAEDESGGFPQQALLGDGAIFQMLRQAGTAGTARVGARVEMGGTQRLQAVTGVGLKTVLVWFGLIAAVIFVGWLVFSLAREMRAA